MTRAKGGEAQCVKCGHGLHTGECHGYTLPCFCSVRLVKEFDGECPHGCPQTDIHTHLSGKKAYTFMPASKADQPKRNPCCGALVLQKESDSHRDWCPGPPASKPTAPEGVAECWTCRKAYAARGLTSEAARQSYRAHLELCRFKGHDVRPLAADAKSR